MTDTTPPDVDKLLSRLSGVRKCGPGKWLARCPAHDDRSPSLSIKDTGDATLIHCFAGCAASDVLVAVGLDFRDLFPDYAGYDPTAPRRPPPRFNARELVQLCATESAILGIALETLVRGDTLDAGDLDRARQAYETVISTWREVARHD